MKRTLNMYVGFLIVAMVALAGAQDKGLSGHWTGTVTRGDRSGPVVLDLKASGGQMAGTISDPSGQVLQIQNWKLEGSQLTFDVTAKEQGHPSNRHFVGDVGDNEIKLHAVKGQQSGPTIVLRRAEN